MKNRFRPSALFFLILLTGLLGCTSEETPNQKGKEQPPAEPSRTVFLVRHAEKADDGTEDPPLTPEGKERANRLWRHLSAAGITAIYSTDYKRTRQTAAPLAENLGLDVEIYDPFEEGIMEKLLNQSGSGNLLVVGHSNTTPMLVNRLLEQEKYRQLSEKAYSDLFVVTIIEGKAHCTVLQY